MAKSIMSGFMTIPKTNTGAQEEMTSHELSLKVTSPAMSLTSSAMSMTSLAMSMH